MEATVIDFARSYAQTKGSPCGNAPRIAIRSIFQRRFDLNHPSYYHCTPWLAEHMWQRELFQRPPFWSYPILTQDRFYVERVRQGESRHENYPAEELCGGYEFHTPKVQAVQCPKPDDVCAAVHGGRRLVGTTYFFGSRSVWTYPIDTINATLAGDKYQVVSVLVPWVDADPEAPVSAYLKWNDRQRAEFWLGGDEYRELECLNEVWALVE